MTRVAVYSALVLSILLGGHEAWAMTGAQLQEICTEGSKEVCQNYIAGVRDATQQLDPQGRPSGLFIMQPYAWCYTREEPVTADREVRTIMAWLRDHPERVRESAARLIANALSDNFNCSRGPDPGEDLEFDFDEPHQ